MFKKATMIVIYFTILVLVLAAATHLFGFYFDRRDFSGKTEQIYGVSFRPEYPSKDFGLDSKETALAIFDELKISHARLIIPWKDIEKKEGEFDFSFFDWFVNEAEKRNIKLVVNIGERVAGWPEYHVPDWAKKLTIEERRPETLAMLKTVVNRYKNSSAVEMWQVENEPLFYWGKLKEIERDYMVKTQISPEFLKLEIDLVKSLDNRPVITTDSGELSDWKQASAAGDYFGTTLYRFFWQRIWKDFGARLYYVYVPPFTLISPAYYHNKATDLGLDMDRVFIMELQSELWIRNEALKDSSPELQSRIFGVKQFGDNLDYARRTGFKRAYLWGAEWWYYLKVNGHPEVWEEAKKLWSPTHSE